MRRATKKAMTAARVEDLSGELGEKAGFSLTNMEEAFKAARKLWTSSVLASEYSSVLYRELELLKEQEKQYNERLETLRKTVMSLTSELDAALAVVRERESTVPEAYRAHDSLQQALQETKNRRDILTAVFERARAAAEQTAQSLPLHFSGSS